MPTKRHTRKPSLTSPARVIALARERGLLRSRDLDDRGLSRETLRRLVADGSIVQRGRGLYAAAGTAFSAQESLALASLRVPHGIVCLLSALRFHDLTTQNPPDVWLAIDRTMRAPVVRDLPLRIVRFSGKARLAGVEKHVIDGVTVRVYSAAKTVADCFKYRHKIGTDVAVEALRDGWRAGRFSMGELTRCAAICRVSRVMRPYLEAVIANEDS